MCPGEAEGLPLSVRRREGSAGTSGDFQTHWETRTQLLFLALPLTGWVTWASLSFRVPIYKRKWLDVVSTTHLKFTFF